MIRKTPQQMTELESNSGLPNSKLHALEIIPDVP